MVDHLIRPLASTVDPADPREVRISINQAGVRVSSSDPPRRGVGPPPPTQTVTVDVVDVPAVDAAAAVPADVEAEPEALYRP